MKKILVLQRHGTAEDGENFVWNDFDRKLVKKGKKEVEEMWKFLKKTLKIFPDIFFSSSAKRTLQTAHIVGKVFRYDEKKIVEKSSLYNSNYLEYLKVVNSASEKEKVIFLSGHNPTITQFASILTWSNLPSMEKGSIVVIWFSKEVSWKDIQKESWKVLAYISTKVLK